MSIVITTNQTNSFMSVKLLTQFKLAYLCHQVIKTNSNIANLCMITNIINNGEQVSHVLTT